MSPAVVDLVEYLLEGRIGGWDKWSPAKVVLYCRDRSLDMDQTAAVMQMIFPHSWAADEVPDNMPELAEAVELSKAALDDISEESGDCAHQPGTSAQDRK